MAKSRKAEKRQKRKEKKRQEIEKKLTEQKVKFDVLNILKNELLDTKPNMAKFLSTYVQMIRAFNPDKIQFYPSFHYSIAKVFIKFLDGHEIIYDMKTDGKITPKFILSYEYEDVKLNGQDIKLIEQFIDYLFKFKFVYGCA